MRSIVGFVGLISVLLIAGCEPPKAQVINTAEPSVEMTVVGTYIDFPKVGQTTVVWTDDERSMVCYHTSAAHDIAISCAADHSVASTDQQ